MIRERDSAVLWIAGLAMSISPGKVAEVLKALVLRHLTGMPFARSAPVIFMERLVDGLAINQFTTTRKTGRLYILITTGFNMSACMLGCIITNGI